MIKLRAQNLVCLQVTWSAIAFRLPCGCVFVCGFVYWFSVFQTCGNIVPCWWGTRKSVEQNYAQAAAHLDRPPARQEIRSIFGKISLFLTKITLVSWRAIAGNQKATTDCLDRTSVRWGWSCFCATSKGNCWKQHASLSFFAWRSCLIHRFGGCCPPWRRYQAAMICINISL